MGYAKIENLYRPRAQDILEFKFVYALEKVHGTSAHVRWDGTTVSFFSGGAAPVLFRDLFDVKELTRNFLERVGVFQTVIYGEAYGGKCQGMSEIYGPDLKFIVFDVLVGDNWLTPPKAELFATQMQLEFVPYTFVSTEGMVHIDNERDKYSMVAARRGLNEKPREGIVLRPPFEVTNNHGARVCAKHKGEAFGERVHTPAVNKDQLVILNEAAEVAEEWVTPMRLTHVLDKIPGPHTIEMTGQVIKAMVLDVLFEGEGEMVDTKAVRRAIGKRAAYIYKKMVTEVKIETNT